MAIQVVSKEYTVTGYLYHALWIALATIGLSGLADLPAQHESAPPAVAQALQVGVLLAGAAAAAGVLIREAYQRHQIQLFLENHGARLAEYAARSHLEYQPDDAARIPEFGQISLIGLHNVRNSAFGNFVLAGDWAYCEYSYQIYKQTKNGEYLDATVYYSVITTQLPRALPNVFFDSKRARGKQFRFEFAREQRYNLEGEFSNYFTTYFPDQYQLDALSFITPDTMLALQAAANYDIEIMQDRLYLYGSLAEPETAVPDMVSKLLAIKKELLDNIVAYRDQRVPYAQGRSGLALEGAELRRSRFWRYVSYAVLAAFVMYQLASMFYKAAHP